MSLSIGSGIAGRLGESTDSGQALSAAGVTVVLTWAEYGVPEIAYWGSELGTAEQENLARALRPPLATNGIDRGTRLAVIPESWTGWTGTPGLEGNRPDGSGWAPRLELRDVELDVRNGAGGSMLFHLQDCVAHLKVRLRIELLASGLLRLDAHVTNDGASAYELSALRLALPVPSRAVELWDQAGRWAKERVPQQAPFNVGSHLREGRHGRTGADAATLLVAGTAGLDFCSGEAWGIHVGFSGNHQVLAERVHSGERLLMGGELLLPGEIVLTPGSSYSTPVLYASHGVGMDQVAGRFHDHLRSRDNHPSSPRPVVLNVWEAVYFDHDLEKLKRLADRAAQIGVERFVLDDGWFGSRRDDTSGLGDWFVSEDVWGHGRFKELVAHVKSKGMDFGLWFEPEMVNPDSALAREHPDWILQVPGRMPVEARNQQVLEVTNPAVFDYLLGRITALVNEYGISFIKWDHNRDLVDAGSPRTGRATVHHQTLATYRLLDEIRSHCPGLEIEACSSGGARVDLGILEHTDRVWGSDCIDAHERQQIQRWTQQLLPPELIGSHIGASRAHTTGRRLDLAFRAATAMFGHFGLEWDLTEATQEELGELARWVGFHKQHRALIHGGRVVRRSLEEDSLWLNGAVAPDASEALYAAVQRFRPVTWPAGPVQLPGLNPDALYEVRPAGPSRGVEFDPRVHPSWWPEGITASGRMLGAAGISLPALQPDQAVLLHVVRAGDE